jgi:tRNA(adenine34) deaminase
MTQDFATKLRHQIKRLATNKYHLLEKDVARKRIDWVRRRYPPSARTGTFSPRRMYEIFLLEYLGLPESDVPVSSETEHQIVWNSTNKCPTLEACAKLGLDTKEVCRLVYEKPVQALISRFDPRLRFYRDYREIRPYSSGCKERIIRVDFEQLMRIAIEEAKTSRLEGNHGYGAVVLLPNQSIVRAHDTATTRGDPIEHAEVNAIRRAIRVTGDANLCGSILVSTCEPCPMCSSLAVWANLTAIVYGASIKETANLGKLRILIPAQEVVDKAPAFIEAIGGILREECLVLYA